MPFYHYRAVNSAGEVVDGRMEADSQAAVVERLQAQGHLPLRADEISARAKIRAPARRRALFTRSKGISQKDVATITQELASLLRAGLPLDRALQIMIEITEEGEVGQLLGRIQEAVRGGASLAVAMEGQTGVFSRFYLNMI